jgi:hypothetical protein
MTSERTRRSKQAHPARALRRAIAFASLLALIVPVAITTLAQPASATTFSVPANIENPSNGFATGITVDNSMTFTATGGWTENINTTCTTCRGPDGITPFENQSNWLMPAANAFALVGRIGTSGPWNVIGSGPTTLNGTGDLYMAMNDRLPNYGDNAGSMNVTIADSLQLSTAYLTEDTPVLAGTPVQWVGQVQNTNDSTLANAQALVNVGTSTTGVPTWTNDSGDTTFGNCDPTEDTNVYQCDFGDITAGASGLVSATADPHGLPPGTIIDSFAVRSDESSGFDAVAPTATQQIDGLRFDVLAPATIGDGNVLSLTTTVTNTSATDTIHGIVVHGAIDSGTFHSGPPGCTVDNGSSPATIDCPSSGSFDLPPGASVDGTTTVNTDGLAGGTIDWSVFATSPDLGGDSYTASGSVDVVTNTDAEAPTIDITAPASGANLGETLPYNFSANAASGAGQTLDYVDLQIDSGPRVIKFAPPFSTPIPANSLSPGTHVLKANAHDTDGQTTSAFELVQVAAPPSVHVIPPPGFSQLDSAQTFTSSATPDSHAPGVTIASVHYKLDGNPVTSTPTSPYAVTLDPALLNLGDGPHALTATATDSTGQSSTDEFDFTVPQATLQVAETSPPIAAVISPGGDAAWPVQVSNTSSVNARNVKLTFDVTATDTQGAPTPLSFDLGAINGGRNLPATTPTCAPGSGSTFVCTLPDLPAHASLSSPFRVFVTTNGVSSGSTITGHAVASATNAPGVTSALGAVSAVSCGTECVVGVAAPGDPFASSPTGPTPTDPTKQVIVLSSGEAGGPQLPTVTVTLSSINTTTTTDPNDHLLCPIAAGQTHCSGQISSVTAEFGAYVNKKNPIRVTIIARWGASVPTGQILMEKSTGGDPIFLLPCVVDPTTREFNTPCVLPEIVHGSAAASDLTTYDTILFVGDDVHFARRVSTGGTIINPPAAPTAVTATAGVGQAVLRWTAPTVTNGAAVSAYVVTVLVAGVVQKTVTFATAALTDTVTGLTAGKSYTFKVQAKNVAGAGTASALSNAIKTITPPGAPTAVTAAAGVGRAVLRWTAPTVTNGGAVSAYVVTVLVAGVVQKTVTFATAALTDTVTGLTAGKSYTFKVQAKNVAGAGAASALSNAVKPT